jgi:hypothetical protein
MVLEKRSLRPKNVLVTGAVVLCVTLGETSALPTGRGGRSSSPHRNRTVAVRKSKGEDVVRVAYLRITIPFPLYSQPRMYAWMR